jgi:hypothetical protein
LIGSAIQAGGVNVPMIFVGKFWVLVGWQYCFALC